MTRYHDLLSWTTAALSIIGIGVGALCGNFWALGLCGSYLMLWTAVQNFWR